MADVGQAIGRQWWHRGGNLYYETGSGGFPTTADYLALSRLFAFDPHEWSLALSDAYAGLTDLDYFDKTYPEDTATLNDVGLRSKPVQLYLDLFRPTIPPTDTRRALVLYGGSGNAGIAAAALGYDVTICEASAERCDLIRGRWDGQVAKWTQKANAHQPVLFSEQPQQLAMVG